MMRLTAWLLFVYAISGNLVLAASFDRSPSKFQIPEFRAGAATSNITPMLGSPIVGNFIEPPALRVHDELHARCLVLDDGTTRLAIVICDNVGISREVFDDAKHRIEQATGIPPKNMLMASTHTHSATSARWPNMMRPGKELSEYQQFVSRRIADGVQRAIANLEPAQIAWGSAIEPAFVFNRRYKLKPGVELLNPVGGKDRAKMNPGYENPDITEPAGPTDPQISFISVRSTTGRPIALLANYSLHYVGGVRSNEISADYFAVFADCIERKLHAERQDPPFVGIMSNGTSGDVNNINVRGGKPTKQQAPYEHMREIAERLADDVMKAHQDVKFQDWVELGAMTRELKLGVRKPSPEQVERAKRKLAEPRDPKAPMPWVYAQRTLDLLDSPDEVSVPLQAMRIGELGIATAPFEVFAETGLQIKERSPFNATFTIELANGSYGYLPTPEQHKLGGYETWLGTNRVEFEASEKMRDALLLMLVKVKKLPL
jgi:hypothetical protein